MSAALARGSCIALIAMAMPACCPGSGDGAGAVQGAGAGTGAVARSGADRGSAGGAPATGVGATTPSVGAGAGDAVSATALLEAHAAQLAKLPSLVAVGVVEVRWRDDQGDHFEQGDLDLRYRAPEELSFRVSKVGETIFMGGCRPDAWWWYEGWSKPTRFWSRPRLPRDPDDAHRPQVTMDEMLALAGLRALGTADGPAIDLSAEGEPGRYAVDLPEATSVLRLPTRAVFAPHQVQGETGWSLVRVEVFDRRGQLMVGSDLSGHRRVERRGAPPGDWPAVASRVSVAVPARGDRGAYTLLVALDRPSATGERIVERLFDPKAVRESLRPQVVDDGGAGAP